MTQSQERGFAEWFGRAPEITADAPGRVNLIGEHTDYNGGYVLPVAIPQRTRMTLAKRADRTAQVASANVPDAKPLSFEIGHEKATHSWVDYVAGVTHALAERGLAIGGFDALVTSDVPIGSGLSSSAALEVAAARALRKAFALAIDDMQIALVGHEAETEFVGVPVGTMDQMAASFGDQRTALFLDARSGSYERVPLPSELEILVIDSGIVHDHATGSYRERREECERARELLGVACLRDVDRETERKIGDLPSPLDRRARHVVSECRRVLEAVVAMKAGDIEKLGVLLDASHVSLRDDFEVSLPAIDALVSITKSAGAIGARLTGGGFGGAIVAITPPGRARSIGAAATAAFMRLGYGRAVVVSGGADA